MKASAETGVTGVCSTMSCGQDSTFTLSAFGIILRSAGGFGISLSTLSGLSGNKPLAAKPALIFFDVNALSLRHARRNALR